MELIGLFGGELHRSGTETSSSTKLSVTMIVSRRWRRLSLVASSVLRE